MSSFPFSFSFGTPYRIVVGITAATLLVAGCDARIPSGAQREAEERNAREAVFRFQFKNNASGLRNGADVYCLEIWQGGADPVDPDEPMLRRLSEGPALVRKSSSCDSGELGVFDKATGTRGLVLRTGKIDWVSGDELQVEGGYYEGPLSASANLYRLKKVNGAWVVVGDEQTAIA